MKALVFDPEVRAAREKSREERESKTLEQVTREVRAERKKRERKAAELAFSSARQ